MRAERSQSAFGGGKRAEEEVTRRLDRGQPRKQILDETGIAPSIVDKVLTMSNDSEFRNRKRAQRDASTALRVAIFAQAAHRPSRPDTSRPRRSSTPPLRLFGVHPVLRFPLEQLLDVRPFALGRDPCARCGARGDVGCKHQRAGEVRHG
jgi:hypothetical protein